MKILKRKNGFTLLEVIISIALIAAVSLPLLSVFSQSIKTDRVAKGVLNANYISQNYIERLDATTYVSALSSLPDHLESGDYFLSAEITPYGTNTGLFDEPCDYAHFICYDNEKMLAVMPDGKWRLFNSMPNEITVTTDGYNYSMTFDTLVIAGEMSHTNCALIINAMKKVSSSTSTITLSDYCKAIVYCRKTAVSDLSIDGSREIYADMISGDTSLVHIKTYVFELSSGGEPVATAESYINIRNW
jgi:prepilin-type N-terminal cleavage/methylation domain-containing protein